MVKWICVFWTVNGIGFTLIPMVLKFASLAAASSLEAQHWMTMTTVKRTIWLCSVVGTVLTKQFASVSSSKLLTSRVGGIF
ncbi:hypothetical protein A8B75_02020 [Sphingomonadales bacterium EhC05]|nr:hypothetical protein A8B75_02020 [Sphingomonadales bacterium EhC05]